MRKRLFVSIVIAALTALAITSEIREVRAEESKQEAGIRVDESGIRAVLKNGATVIALPISNTSNHPKLPVTVVDLACFHDIRSLTLIGNHVKCKRFL